MLEIHFLGSSIYLSRFASWVHTSRYQREGLTPKEKYKNKYKKYSAPSLNFIDMRVSFWLRWGPNCRRWGGRRPGRQLTVALIANKEKKRKGREPGLTYPLDPSLCVSHQMHWRLV